MPLSMCKKLDMGDIKRTNVALQLVDKSLKYPIEVLEDFPMRVGEYYVSLDFVIMGIGEDCKIPIILGRPFLSTAWAIIDVKRGKLTFELDDEKI